MVGNLHLDIDKSSFLKALQFLIVEYLVEDLLVDRDSLLPLRTNRAQKPEVIRIPLTLRRVVDHLQEKGYQIVLRAVRTPKEEEGEEERERMYLKRALRLRICVKPVRLSSLFHLLTQIHKGLRNRKRLLANITELHNCVVFRELGADLIQQSFVVADYRYQAVGGLREVLRVEEEVRNQVVDPELVLDVVLADGREKLVDLLGDLDFPCCLAHLCGRESHALFLGDQKRKCQRWASLLIFAAFNISAFRYFILFVRRRCWIRRFLWNCL